MFPPGWMGFYALLPAYYIDVELFHIFAHVMVSSLMQRNLLLGLERAIQSQGPVQSILWLLCWKSYQFLIGFQLWQWSIFVLWHLHNGNRMRPSSFTQATK